MTSDLIAGQLTQWLLESALGTSIAILAVLLLRAPVRRAFGAGVGYALWLLLPAAWLAVLLPAPMREVVIAMPTMLGGAAGPIDASDASLVDRSVVLIAAALVWLAGASAFLLATLRQQRAFLRRLGPLTPRGDGLLQARAMQCLPAVIGLRARIVVPDDFDTRYSADERRLILAHERTHVRRGDLLVQGGLLLFRSLYWFNPLAWLAVERVRRDQELAVDASVIARHPQARRTYGEAMVKITLGHASAPLACHWVGIHPLKERLTMLKKATPSRRTRLIGLSIVTTLTLGTAGAAWALQTPETTIAPPPMDAPGTVTVKTKPFDEAMSPPSQRPVTISVERVPVIDAARRAAELGRMTIANPEVLSSRKVTFEMKGVPVATLLQLIAEEDGKEAVMTGNTVRFVEPASAPPPAAAGKPSAAAAIPAARTPAPPYPPAAIAAKQSGKVVLLIDVAADGSVSDVKVETSTPAGVFDQATIDAARTWTFKPRIESGKPVAGRVRVPVTFDVDGETGAPAAGVPNAS